MFGITWIRDCSINLTTSGLGSSVFANRIWAIGCKEARIYFVLQSLPTKHLYVLG